MLLYHFTSGRYLRPIARHGLTVGDVPLDIHKNTGRYGVWLTSATKPDGHGLEGSALDKKEYRLTVEVDETDPCLVQWSKWAPGRVAERTIASLNLVAEGHASWWVYFGVIPPLAIKKCVRTVTWLEVENWPEVSPIELDCPGVPAWHRKAWHNRLLKAVDKKLRQNGFSGRLSDTSARIP